MRLTSPQKNLKALKGEQSELKAAALLAAEAVAAAVPCAKFELATDGDGVETCIMKVDRVESLRTID